MIQQSLGRDPLPLAVFEIKGFRLSEPTKYSDGQPQLAMELSVGQPAHISGTIQHTKVADDSLDRS